MIREAVIGDLPVIVDMGSRFRRESQYREFITFDPDVMWETAEKMIAGETSTILVAVSRSGIIGMLGVCTYQHPISGQKFATELFWWVEPEHRGKPDSVRLLKEAESWSRKMGAVSLQMIAPQSTPELGPFYARFGFQPVEVSYQKRL